jgi:hypothetical protein
MKSIEGFCREKLSLCQIDARTSGSSGFIQTLLSGIQSTPGFPLTAGGTLSRFRQASVRLTDDLKMNRISRSKFERSFPAESNRILLLLVPATGISREGGGGCLGSGLFGCVSLSFSGSPFAFAQPLRAVTIESKFNNFIDFLDSNFPFLIKIS